MAAPLSEEKSDPSIRSYRAGDETSLLEGFNATFHISRTLAHWQWKFGRNPGSSGPLVSVALDPTGTPVGQVAAVPMRINFTGAVAQGGQVVDLYVRAGAGFHAFFFHGARQIEALCRERGIGVLYTFPNPNSFPGFVRMGWTRVGFLKEYVRRLSVHESLLRFLRVRVLADVCDFVFRIATRAMWRAKGMYLRARAGRTTWSSISETLPDGYEGLWDQVKPHEVISVCKDADYMRWRYDQHPDRDFTYLALRDPSGLCAVAVACTNNKLFMVTELMVAGRNVLNARILLNQLVSYAGRRGFTRVVFAGSDGGFFNSAFCDFKRVPTLAHVFCAKAFPPHSEITASHASNWTITLGDGDAF